MLPPLGLGAASLLLALAQAVAPRPDQPPWQWAEGRIVIANFYGGPLQRLDPVTERGHAVRLAEFRGLGHHSR